MASTVLELVTKVRSVLSGYALKLIVAIIILLIGFIIGRIAGKISQKILHEVELDNILKKTVKLKISIEQMIGNLAMYFVYFVAIIMALKQINIATDILNIILGAFMVMIILALFLSIKDFVPNLISGIFINRKHLIDTGDYIRVDNIQGKVIEINLVDTLVQTRQGDIIYIPNSRLTKSEVIKISKKKL